MLSIKFTDGENSSDGLPMKARFGMTYEDVDTLLKTIFGPKWNYSDRTQAADSELLIRIPAGKNLKQVVRDYRLAMSALKRVPMDDRGWDGRFSVDQKKVMLDKKVGVTSGEFLKF